MSGGKRDLDFAADPERNTNEIVDDSFRFGFPPDARMISALFFIRTHKAGGSLNCRPPGNESADPPTAIIRDETSRFRSLARAYRLVIASWSAERHYLSIPSRVLRSNTGTRSAVRNRDSVCVGARETDSRRYIND